jgi:hypothetical protein
MTVLNKLASRLIDEGRVYSTDELMARLKVFIGVCLTLTLMGIIFTILYSVIFVTQPLKGISPIDQKFFEVIIPVASFLCGILSGIMLNGTNAGEMDAMKTTMAAFKDTSAQAGKLPTPAPDAMPAAPIRREPVVDVPVQPVTTGAGGKLAPPPAPEPEMSEPSPSARP